MEPSLGVLPRLSCGLTLIMKNQAMITVAQ